MKKENKAEKLKEVENRHSQRYAELPENIRTKAVKHIRDTLPLQQAIDIRKDHKEHGGLWFAGSHFTWGMALRNFLRGSICLDQELPSGNWDDYYVPLVEVAIGLRDG